MSLIQCTSFLVFSAITNVAMLSVVEPIDWPLEEMTSLPGESSFMRDVDPVLNNCQVEKKDDKMERNSEDPKVITGDLHSQLTQPIRDRQRFP